MLTAADLEAFLDGLLPAQIAQDDIAGAVVLMVKNGAVFFAKGYGYADVEHQTPVSPATTPLPNPAERLWMNETAIPSPSTTQK